MSPPAGQGPPQQRGRQPQTDWTSWPSDSIGGTPRRKLSKSMLLPSTSSDGGDAAAKPRTATNSDYTHTIFSQCLETAFLATTSRAWSTTLYTIHSRDPGSDCNNRSTDCIHNMHASRLKTEPAVHGACLTRVVAPNLFVGVGQLDLTYS